MIKLDQVRLRQGNFELADLTFEVPEFAYAVLMGSTGSGKTTLLEAVCGLRRVNAGRVRLGDQDITKLPPAARGIGFVPQDAALFPTMRVDRQIGFALEVRNVNSSDRRKRVESLAEMLGIREILERTPNGLSGGERQRVALARALSHRPQVLCLDEPLSALDESTRARLGRLLKKIHEEENITVLHVTHHATEAKELGTDFYRVQSGTIQLISRDEV
jgi:ABC-type sugar transport system ATPase subunit